MIAISSHRPHDEKKDALYVHNQIRAVKTWVKYFDKIIYFGPYQRALAHDKVQFIPSDNYPFIWQMAQEASRQNSKYVAIINADIVVTKNFSRLEKIMDASDIRAASSRRRDLDTKELLPDDKGRDIFVCRTWVWKAVASAIPKTCRIGHQQWDSWMIAFLRTKLQNRFGEFTRIPCIYHPRHGGREMPHAASVDISQSPYKISVFRNDPQLVLEPPVNGKLDVMLK